MTLTTTTTANAEASKNWLECAITLDTHCIAEALAPVFNEWSVQLFIILPVILLAIRFAIHALLSVGIPMPFVSERINQFTDKDNPIKLSFNDQKTITELNQKCQQATNLMTTVDTWLEKLFGGPIFSLASYQRTLLLAFVYPIVIMLTIWLFAGYSNLGGLETLPTLPAVSRLYFYLLFVAIVTYAILVQKYATNFSKVIQKKLPRVKVYIIDFFIGVICTIWLLPFIPNINSSFPFTFLLIFCGAIAYIGASAGRCSSAVVGVSLMASLISISVGIYTVLSSIAAVVITLLVLILTVPMYLGLAIDNLIKREEKKYSVFIVLFAFIIYTLIVSSAVYLPTLSPYFYKTPAILVTGAFVMLFFFSFLPILNALSDWLSVSFTRWLFKAYRNSDSLPLHLIISDLFFTLLLCLFLYHGMLGLLSAMQTVGWQQVNVQKIVQAFYDAPLSSQSSWLTFLVITNFIPLLLHYLALIWGIWHRRWSPAHIPDYVAAIQNQQALTKTDARIFAMFLTWDRWLNVTAMLLLIPSMYLSIQWLLRWSLKFWL